MKTNLLSQILWVILFTSVCFDACIKDPIPPQNSSSPQNNCSETSNESQISINCFDFNPYSLYYYQSVCVFTIKKESIERTGTCSNLPLSECKNYVRIKNISGRTISFNYSIDYTLNLYHWNYQNAVTIEPDKTTEFEYINDNCGSLELGQTTISTTLITYQ